MGWLDWFIPTELPRASVELFNILYLYYVISCCERKDNAPLQLYSSPRHVKIRFDRAAHKCRVNRTYTPQVVLMLLCGVRGSEKL